MSNSKLNYDADKALLTIQKIEEATNIQKTISKLPVKAVVNLLYYLNYQYHTEGKQPVTDTIYDILKLTLEDNDPDNKFLKVIGAPTVASTDWQGQGINQKLKKKVELPYFMGSLNKIKANQKDIDNWVKRFNTPNDYLLSDKLDGISMMYIYENFGNGGYMQNFYTRGDGTNGQDVSDILKHINFNKALKMDKKVAQKIVVRGELIIKKDTFDKKYQDQFSNPRNMISGMVFRLDCDKDILKDIDYIVYEVLEPSGLTPSEQIDFLLKNNFKVPFYKQYKIKDLEVEKLSKLYIQRRQDSPYEIDGIVIKHNSVYDQTTETIKWGFAFKDFITNEQAQVVVNKVEWNISKDGLLKPKVLFNPVKLEGSMIKQATGHNAKFIFDNRIGPGSKIIIIKSGSVIPKIQQVLESAMNGEPQMPPKKYKWKWNDNKVEAVVEGAFDEIKLKELQNFFSTIKVDGFSDQTIERLFQQGYNTIPKLRSITVEELSELERFQKKSATNIVNGIHQRFEELKKPVNGNCALIMVASNQFGNGLGMKRAQMVIGQFSELIDKREKPTLQQLSTVEGISDIIAAKIIMGFNKFYKWIEENKIELPKCTKEVQKQKQQEKKIVLYKQSPYFGKKIAFSGFRDKPLEDLLTLQFRVSIVNSVNKQTNFVVAKDPEEYSSKLRRAKELSIKIIEKEKFDEEIKKNMGSGSTIHSDI